jgi:hypothetical protein
MTSSHSRRRKEADLSAYLGPPPYVGGYFRDEAMTLSNWGSHPMDSNCDNVIEVNLSATKFLTSQGLLV